MFLKNPLKYNYSSIFLLCCRSIYFQIFSSIFWPRLLIFNKNNLFGKYNGSLFCKLKHSGHKPRYFNNGRLLTISVIVNYAKTTGSILIIQIALNWHCKYLHLFKYIFIKIFRLEIKTYFLNTVVWAVIVRTKNDQKVTIPHNIYIYGNIWDKLTKNRLTKYKGYRNKTVYSIS